MTKVSKQRLILQEFLKAQSRGFVEKIDLELSKGAGKILYDPDTTMYKTEWDWLDCKPVRSVSDSDDLDEFPDFSSLYVRFNNSVRQSVIEQIAQYVIKQYDCKVSVYNGRIDVYGL